jgi:hypothetical protein
MLAINPAGLLVSLLLIAALTPGKSRLLRAAGAVAVGELCRSLAALLFSGAVMQITVGGAWSEYILQHADLPTLSLASAGVIALAGVLGPRSLRAPCLVYALLTAAPPLLSFLFSGAADWLSFP